MISTKTYTGTSVNGVNKRFLFEFISPADNFVRVFIHTLGAPSLADLVSPNAYDLIDNSIAFYNAPYEGSTITIEVATTPEEFGNSISLPAADRADAAANLAEQYAIAARGYRDQSQAYSIDSADSAEEASYYAQLALNRYNETLNASTQATNSASSAAINATSAHSSYLACKEIQDEIDDTVTGALAVSNDALNTAETALTNSINANNSASIASSLASLAYQQSNSNTLAINGIHSDIDGINFALNDLYGVVDGAVLTADGAQLIAETAITDAFNAQTTADSALTLATTADANSSTALTTAIAAQDTADAAYTLASLAGGSRVYYTGTSSTSPTGAKNGDIHIYYTPDAIITTTYLYIVRQFNGSSWNNVMSANNSNLSGTYYTARSSDPTPAVGKMWYNTTSYLWKISYRNSGGTIIVGNIIKTGSLNNTTNFTSLIIGTTAKGSIVESGGYLLIQTTAFNTTRDGVSIGNAMFSPNEDNNQSLGWSSKRWSTLYVTSGVIYTSDERAKTDIRELNEQELAVAIKLKKAIKAFKFKDAIEVKGIDKARIHIGVIAQEVKIIFESEGLDAFNYGILCYDTWEETQEVLAEDGTIATNYIPSGDRYGVRYEELYAFIIAAM